MNTETLTSVAVVGPGAIGTTIAAALHEVGRTPLLCGRTSRDHLTLQDGERDITIPGPVQTDPRQIDHAVDLVFLAVKTTQTEAAVDWLAALIGPETVVCVLQNGVEQLEKVTPHFPDARIVPAVVWFPAQAQSDGSVRLRGDVHLSLPDTPASRVAAEALQGTRCFVELAEDFRSLAWRKLLQNAAAGLMALTHRRSGMFARSDISRLTLDYLQECLAVARAEGAELGDEVPRAILDKFLAAPADMGTSILTDREAGRPLEWEVRNGVVSRRGRAHGIPTPISDVLVPLLAAASDGPG
ncbi:oxidoreductase [Pandoraea pulmonicola]|uniref:2-dehydropantoate 2-reductase n=1 Tax=Pandoraea pulmonicola TaxID=93221 RepID=A0AAJ4Z8J3_PANPU|nr:oxidoreductase [Pandoraea pulmonicola]AJC22200.1 2-dehydropantoate 2-reductase [Pandoraea pulmonicola]SUA88758.1 2-dehydropantoate 2-reductase [Pandoraea pulmonicola]